MIIVQDNAVSEELKLVNFKVTLEEKARIEALAARYTAGNV